MSEKFDFKRFIAFFRYDLNRIWKYNGKTLLFIGFGPIILLIFWEFHSLLFTWHFSVPILPFRIIGLFIALFILELYITKVYGFITNKKAGSDFLLLPASVTEKYLSLMINILVVIPLAFGAVYAATDALICLILPECGPSLLSCAFDAGSGITEFFNTVRAESTPGMANFIPSFSGFYAIMTFSFFYNFLFFTFCSIVFRRLKILWGLLISSGIGSVLMFTMLFFIGAYTPESHMFDDYQDYAIRSMNSIYMISAAFSLIGTIVLAILIYRRFKRITH